MAAAFFAGAFFAAIFLAGAAVTPSPAAFLAVARLVAAFLAAVVFPAAVFRGGYLLTRGSNSKTTRPSSALHAKKALNARRVRMDTNLSSKSVFPVVSSF